MSKNAQYMFDRGVQKKIGISIVKENMVEKFQN